MRSNLAAQLNVLPDESGVYLMRHRITGDAYVGSAGSIRGRFAQHIYALRRGKHHNPRVTALAASHGIDFECSVLELTGDAPRFPAERRWIQELCPRLNGRPPGKGGGRDEGRTRQLNARLSRAIVARVDAFSAAHPLRPSFTQIVEAAVREWLDRNEVPAADKPPRKGKPS